MNLNKDWIASLNLYVIFMLMGSELSSHIPSKDNSLKYKYWQKIHFNYLVRGLYEINCQVVIKMFIKRLVGKHFA